MRNARTYAKTVARAGAAAALLALTACETAIVPLTAYAVDGLSYASSGKGITDHAISAATKKDCALYRFAQGAGICNSGPALDEAPALAMVGGGDTARADRKEVREILERAAALKELAPADGSGGPSGPGEKPAGGKATAVPFN